MRIAAAVVAAALLLAGCAPAAAPAGERAVTRPAASPSPSPAAAPLELGVYEPDEASDYGQVTAFGDLAGRQPDLVLVFDDLAGGFPSRLARTIRAHGAEPVVQINPHAETMAAVAAGDDDGALRAYADGVRAYGFPVILSFAAEANGPWYQWGWTHTAPAVWVAAWRHVVDLFRSAGVTNATWMWTIAFERDGGVAPDTEQYWPGAAYAGMVGIDGYEYFASSDYASTFESSVQDVRSYTTDPVLLSEVAIGPVAGASKIAGLFAGARADGLLGIVWFDMAQSGGPYRQDWRLEDDPAAARAFAAAVRG